MKILHILMDVRSSWGGPVHSVGDLVRMQRSLGIETCVLGVRKSGSVEDFEGTELAFFEPSFPARFRNSRRAVAWLRQNASRFDLVLVNEIWSFITQRACLVLRQLNVPYVVQPRGSLDPYDLQKKALLKRILGPLVVRRNLAGARCVLTACSLEQERMETYGAIVRRRTLPHPVKANAPGDGPGLRKDLGIPSNTLVFLYLSRIDPKKRVDLLLEAIGQAASRLPPFRLLVAGNGPPALLQALKAQAAALDCASNITFLGFQGGQRKCDLLAAADIFVLPSEFENFGIAVVEALHAGLPVVLSTGVQIWQEIITAGAGLSFAGDAGELAELFVRIGTDPLLRATMSRAAVRHAFQFTPEQLASSYREFWSSMANTNAR